MNNEITPAAGTKAASGRSHSAIWLALAILVCLLVYWPGLSGGFLFDDYPNIVDNKALQIDSVSVHNLSEAAWSSRSSELKRPLSSISFALDYVAHGLDPYWMKLTNLVIHILNGIVLFGLIRMLARLPRAAYAQNQAMLLAAFVAGAWLVLPINLTAVLYVVQRMESLANLFVLLGLTGYVSGRRAMLSGHRQRGAITATLSIACGTLLGLGAKETAVLLPLYACCIEWALIQGFSKDSADRKFVATLFTVFLLIPLVVGCSLLLPHLLNPGAWATRAFTLTERLLTEPHIVLLYIKWALLPNLNDLSFYHDDITVSTGLFHPWTTVVAVIAIAGLCALTAAIRRRSPLGALGIGLFLCAQTLTATVLPLELVFEHRNYFASAGLLLLLGTLLIPAIPPNQPTQKAVRAIIACALFVFWSGLTFLTSKAWSDPSRFAVEMAARAPNSSRAQYRLGAALAEASGFSTDSPLYHQAEQAFLRSAQIPESSILGEQGLILLACKAQQPIPPLWWREADKKLRDKRPSPEDISSVVAIWVREHEGQCQFPPEQLLGLFQAATAYPNPDPNVLSAFAEFASIVLQDTRLAASIAVDAANADPENQERQKTAIALLIMDNQLTKAKQALNSAQTRVPPLFNPEARAALALMIEKGANGESTEATSQSHQPTQ